MKLSLRILFFNGFPKKYEIFINLKNITLAGGLLQEVKNKNHVIMFHMPRHSLLVLFMYNYTCRFEYIEEGMLNIFKMFVSEKDTLSVVYFVYVDRDSLSNP